MCLKKLKNLNRANVVLSQAVIEDDSKELRKEMIAQKLQWKLKANLNTKSHRIQYTTK